MGARGDDRPARGRRHEVRNVDAVVVEGLPTNLLGQSVLRRLGKVELSGDRMVIHKELMLGVVASAQK